MSETTHRTCENPSNDYAHQPVLVEAVLQLLSPGPGQVMLDCTIGLGGHAERIIPLLGPGGRYIGLDVDPGNVHTAGKRLRGPARDAGVDLTVIQGNFRDAAELIRSVNASEVDLLLADLGFASNQMNDPARGMSFSMDGPLDMRLDPNLPTSAAELVASLNERDLADLLYHYGEERLSKKIARKIIEHRQYEPIVKTRQLAELVRRSYGPRGRKMKIDPATRTFMALRIAVNGELEALERLLAKLPQLVRTGGRVGVISFHSLEDRQVKQMMMAWNRIGTARRLTKKPVRAEAGEIDANPRSRSAKLRAAVMN